MGHRVWKGRVIYEGLIEEDSAALGNREKMTQS